MQKIKFLIGLLIFSVVFIALGLPSCKKNNSSPANYNADKTRLKAVLDSLTNVYNNSVEGAKPGNYAVGAKANLDSALVLANQVVNGSTFTQEQVDNSVINLLNAGVIFQNNYIQEVAATNLVAQWKFNGSANDVSGNGHNGILATNYIGTYGHAYDGNTLPALSKDRFGNLNSCYHFVNGATIEVPYSSSFVPQSLSISTWLKLDSNVNCGNYFFALNRWFSYKFNLQCSSFLLFTLHTDQTWADRDDNPGTVPVGQWVHVAVTYSNGSEKFYINGTLTKTWTNVTGNVIPPSPGVNLTIGNEMPKSNYQLGTNGDNEYWGTDAFYGYIDDVRFYNTQLSDSQIKSIYTIESTP